MTGLDPLNATEGNTFEGAPSFSFANRIERLAWKLCWLLLARWTPLGFNIWRLFLLRLFGAEVHSTARVSPSATIWFPRHLKMMAHAALGPGVDCYNMARISIGSYTIISQRAVLCAGSHAVDSPDFQLITRPIEIGPNVWIAMEAFVGPGVTIGENAVLGARACAFSDMEAGAIYAGNPARKLRLRKSQK